MALSVFFSPTFIPPIIPGMGTDQDRAGYEACPSGRIIFPCWGAPAAVAAAIMNRDAYLANVRKLIDALSAMFV